MPNWYELLSDYKLIDEKTWHEILEQIGTSDECKYNVLTSGISFTVLKADENSDLIFNNNRNSFHSEVDFEERISEIKINTNIGFPFSPYFRIKWGIEGYDIGISTLESNKKVIMVGDDNEFDKVTTIPYSLFQISKYRFGIMKPEQLQEQLKKYGWLPDESHESFKEDVLSNVPDMLEHKYFTMYHWRI